MPIRVYHEPGAAAGIALGVADAARAIGDAKIAAAKIKYEAAQEKARQQQQLALGLSDQFQRTMMQLAQVKQRTQQWQEAAKRDERRAERAIAAEGRAAEREKQAERRKYHTQHREKYGTDPIGLMAKYEVDSLPEAQRLWREDEAEAKGTRALGAAEDKLELGRRYDIDQEQRSQQAQIEKEQRAEKRKRLQREREARDRGEGYETVPDEGQNREVREIEYELLAVDADDSIPQPEKDRLWEEGEQRIHAILENPKGKRKIVVPFEQRLSTHQTEDFLWTEQIDGDVTVTKKTPIRDDKDKRREAFADKSLGREIETRPLNKPMTAEEQANAYFAYLEAYDTGQQQAETRALNRAWLKKANPKIPQLDEQGLIDLGQQLQERFGPEPKNREAAKLRVKIADRLNRLQQQKLIQQQTQMPTSQPAMAPAGGGGYGWLEGGG